mmetsp:Transcript_263/g.781  ORF Transcript_263/g.781 Transcript_263/m.781 type:complete len:385 (-) Transcript_263:3028-4182(-)
MLKGGERAAVSSSGSGVGVSGGTMRSPTEWTGRRGLPCCARSGDLPRDTTSASSWEYGSGVFRDPDMAVSFFCGTIPATFCSSCFSTGPNCARMRRNLSRDTSVHSFEGLVASVSSSGDVRASTRATAASRTQGAPGSGGRSVVGAWRASSNSVFVPVWHRLTIGLPRILSPSTSQTLIPRLSTPMPELLTLGETHCDPSDRPAGYGSSSVRSRAGDLFTELRRDLRCLGETTGDTECGDRLGDFLSACGRERRRANGMPGCRMCGDVGDAGPLSASWSSSSLTGPDSGLTADLLSATDLSSTDLDATDLSSCADLSSGSSCIVPPRAVPPLEGGSILGLGERRESDVVLPQKSLEARARVPFFMGVSGTMSVADSSPAGLAAF